MGLDFPVIVHFLAEGTPRTKGNWSAVIIRGVARLIPGKSKGERDALEGWSEIVQLFARRAMGMRDPMNGAVRAELLFVLPRPKTVRRLWPFGQGDGDLDKYCRAVFDDCEGIVYTNDARICQLRADKRYVADTGGERPFAGLTFTELSE